MIDTALKDLLVADSGVSALISTRIYDSALPRSYTVPAVCYHRFGVNQQYDFSGPISVVETSIQYDVYAADAATARSVTEAIKAVLTTYVGTLNNGTQVQACYLEQDLPMPMLPDATTKGVTFHIVLQYRVVHTA
jgi:hypothetical protein